MSEEHIELLKACEDGPGRAYRATSGTSRALIEAAVDGGAIVVVSDLHLAEGQLAAGVYANLENFFAGASFDRFLAATQARQQRPETLVINGDFIDFPRIRFCPRRKEDFEQWAQTLARVGVRGMTAAKLERRVSDRDRKLGMNTERYKSVLKLAKVIDGHGTIFDRLARWLMGKNKLFIVKGNTDLELYFKQVRDLLRLTLAERIVACGGAADVLGALREWVLPGLHFIDDVLVFGKRIHIEHGHRYDPFARSPGDEPLLPEAASAAGSNAKARGGAGRNQLNLPFSALSRRYLLNDIEEHHPYLDNIRPRANLLPILMRSDFPLALRLLVKHLPFLVYCLRRNQILHGFRRAAQALALITAILVPALVAIWMQWQSLHDLTVRLQAESGASVWLRWAKELVVNCLPLVLSYLLARMIALLQLRSPDSLHEHAWPLFADDHQLRVIAFGHTHCAEQIRHQDTTFFNTGTWIPVVEADSATPATSHTLHVLRIEPDALGEMHGALSRWNDDAGRLDAVIARQRDATVPMPSGRADPTAISRYELPWMARPATSPAAAGAATPAKPTVEPEELELTLVLSTPHGERIERARVELVGSSKHYLAGSLADGRQRLRIERAGDYQLSASCFDQDGSFDLRTLRASLFYLHHDGQRTLRVLAPDPACGVFTQVRKTRAGFEVHAVIQYLWFTDIGYPPRLGNAVKLLHDGEQAWAAVATAIQAAKRTVHVTTWIYQPTAELLRPSPLDTPEERQRFTAQAIFEERARAGATVRLLLWDAPFIAAPKPARQAAKTAGDNFEVLQQHNPTKRRLLKADEWGLYASLLGNFQIGSYHQKSVVVDGHIGFCGGMNLKENDWDTHQHHLFEPSRCHFDRSVPFRTRVKRRLERADHPPRHDFMAQLTGPAVHDLERNFQQRYNFLIDNNASWTENASRVSLPAEPRHSASNSPSRQAGRSQVQVVRTMPEPFNERGILDVYVRAIRNARRYIYIEDQYFRSTAISDEIADAVRRWPELHVLVVTSRAQAETAYAGWTHHSVNRIRERRASFELYTLMSHGVDDAGEAQLLEVDNHAKLMLVDDIFMTVGSCNINDRGFEFEGELNVAVVDRELVRNIRVDLWRAHLQERDRISGAPDQLDAEVTAWLATAEANRNYQLSANPPAGSVFPFLPGKAPALVEYDVA